MAQLLSRTASPEFPSTVYTIPFSHFYTILCRIISPLYNCSIVCCIISSPSATMLKQNQVSVQTGIAYKLLPLHFYNPPQRRKKNVTAHSKQPHSPKLLSHGIIILAVPSRHSFLQTHISRKADAPSPLLLM